MYSFVVSNLPSAITDQGGETSRPIVTWYIKPSTPGASLASSAKWYASTGSSSSRCSTIFAARGSVNPEGSVSAALGAVSSYPLT